MIGVGERVCCFCSDLPDPWGLWFDYFGRPRYVCTKHAKIPESERNRFLISGVVPQ